MVILDKDEEVIQAGWMKVLKRRNCMEIYEYLYSSILNEDYVGDYALDKKSIVRLLKMAKEYDLPNEPAPYANLKQDIEHYIEVYGKDAP
jgi:hypothetical protein